MQFVLSDIIRRLEARHFPNEQAIKQGVVLHLLNSLGWDVWDSKAVWPEFFVEGGHVDFALCHPMERPRIFIEVKKSSTFNIGEDQLMMKYAFMHGVPIAVLTDGQRWSFYLPSGDGSFEERRFYLLDLFERDLEEIEMRLRRYLAFDEVKTGRAFEAARADHDDAARRRAIAGALPIAWKEMLQDADPRLIQAVADKVESSTGYQPQETEVATFLRAQIEGFIKHNPKVTKQTSSPQKLVRTAAPQVKSQVEASENWYSINQVEKLRSKKAIDVTVGAFREVGQMVPEFLEEVAREMQKELQKRGRKINKRRWIARSKEELYSDPRHWNKSIQLAPGWWLGTNYSNDSKREMLATAAKVAKNFGIDLEFHLV
jgi:predicted type IV restriction endonuclease